MRKAHKTSKLVYILVGIALLYAAYSRYIYHSIRLEEGTHITEALEKIEPVRIQRLMHNDEPHYILTGSLPGMAQCILLPSSPPIYIFDADGLLIDYIRDPGDTQYDEQTYGDIQNAQTISREQLLNTISNSTGKKAHE